MDGDIFENTPHVTDKKDALSKISGYVWTWPEKRYRRNPYSFSDHIKHTFTQSLFIVLGGMNNFDHGTILPPEVDFLPQGGR